MLGLLESVILWVVNITLSSRPNIVLDYGSFDQLTNLRGILRDQNLHHFKAGCAKVGLILII